MVNETHKILYNAFFVFGDCSLWRYWQQEKGLSFSAPGGSYDQPFYLEIYADRGSEIYYTLNGSIPDRDSLTSIKYEEPIYLENITDRDNVWASASDMSEYFYDEKPSYKVDKGNIVRAVAYNSDGEAGEVLSGTYFIGLPREKYENIAVASLIVDPEDFWGYEKGIYVKGITQELYPEAADPGKVDQVAYAANFNMRGREWERICDTEWFFPEKEFVEKQRVGIRIKGNYSRCFAQKSFNLFAREEYGENKYFYVHNGFYECRAVKNLLYMNNYWRTDNSFYSSNYDISPNEISKTTLYHIGNLYRDAVNSDTIRFIDKENMNVIEIYIREHYCSTAHAVVEDEIEGYQVYKIIDESRS